MARDVQRPLSIPEPTNDVDSLWRTTQVLKEAVEIIQGIRGNREYALKCDLDDLSSEVTNVTITGGGGSSATALGDLSDVDTIAAQQYDLLFNVDGLNWEPTAGDLQWDLSAQTLHLANNYGISWDDSGGSQIRMLELTSSDAFTVGNRTYITQLDSLSVDMPSDTPFRWQDTGAVYRELVNFEANSFNLGNVFYPTELFGTYIGLENGIGINWDNGAGNNTEMLVLDTTPGGDPIEATIKKLAPDFTTTNTSYTEVTGLTVGSADLTTGKKYLYFVRAHIGMNFSTQTWQAAVHLDGTVQVASQIQRESEGLASANEGEHYFHWGVIDSYAGEDINLRIRAVGTGTAYVLEDATMTVIDITDLVDGTDYISNENTSSTALSSGGSAFASITVGDGTSDWLYFWYSSTDGSNGRTRQLRTEIRNNNTAEDFTVFVGGAESAQIIAGGVHCRQAVPTGSTVDLFMTAENFLSANHGYSGIFALRLNAFGDYSVNVDSSPINQGRAGGPVTTHTHTATLNTDYFTIGHVHDAIGSSDTTAAYTYDWDINNGAVTTYGYDGLYQNTSGGATWPQSVLPEAAITLASADELNVELYRDNLAPAEAADTEAFIVVFSLSTGGTSDVFTVGDPSIATNIDGPTTTVTGNLEVDGTTTGVGAASFQDTLAVTGATTLSNGLTVTGANIVAGTVDADFDAITATSYGGILEANLLDKTASETITGTYTFPTARFDNVYGDDDTTNLTIYGGIGTGANIELYGGSHATQAGNAFYDANLHTFRDDSGSPTFATINSSRVDIRGGVDLRIRDATDADYVDLLHNGTDFSASFVNTVDWDITGLTGEVFVDADLRVSGDFTTSGTLTSINTANVNIADNIIVLNSDAVDPPTENAGLEIERGGVVSNVLFRWNETSDRWEFTNDGSTYNDVLIQGDAGTVPDGTTTNASLYWDGSDWLERTAIRLASDHLEVRSGAPTIWFYETDAAVNNQNWYVGALGEAFTMRAYDDAFTSSSIFFNVTRTLNNIDAIDITGDNIDLNGSLSVIDTQTALMRSDFTNSAGSGNRQTDLHINAQAGEDFYLGINYTGTAGPFFDNRTTGDYSFRFNGTDDYTLSSTVFNVLRGNSIRVWDSTNADYLGLSHDGTSFNISALNTSSLSISDLTGQLRLLDGIPLRVYDGTNTDYGTFSHDGTDFNLALTGTTDFNVTGFTGAVRMGQFVINDASSQVVVNGGDEFQIRDSTNADTAGFSHDGTDFNTTFTNTTDWEVGSGLTGAVNFNADILVVSGTSIGAGSPNTAGFIPSGLTREGSPYFDIDTQLESGFYKMNSSANHTGSPESTGFGNLLVLDNLDVHSQIYFSRLDDGRLYTRSATTTDFSALGWNDVAFSNLDETVSGTWLFTGEPTVNVEANSATRLYVGESTTLRGDSQDGGITIYGEQTGTIRTATISNSGTNYQEALSTGMGRQTSGGAGYVWQLFDGVNFRIYNSADTDYVQMNHDGTDFYLSGTNTRLIRTNNVDLLVQSGTFYLNEQASANADFGGYGQIWVRNDVPNTLMFTDDTGVDHDLTAGGTTTLDGLTDTALTSPQSGDILKYNGTNWINSLTFEDTMAFTNGSAPFTVTSTSTVTNLSAQFLSGIAAGSFLRSNTTDSFSGTLSSGGGDINMNDNDIIRANLSDYSVVTDDLGTVTDANQTLTYANGNTFELDLENWTANRTITLSGGPPTGTYGIMEAKIQQDGTAARTITWAGGTFRWAGGSAHPMNSTLNGISIFVFETWDGGTTWYASGADYS